MIYFDNDTKTKLISKLYDSLEHGGYLFLEEVTDIIDEVDLGKFMRELDSANDEIDEMMKILQL